jgi:hypothetical protein
MISRKWLYSYRMLTARLHEGTQAPTNRVTGFVGSVPPPPEQLSVRDELTEPRPTRPALTAVGKT